MAMEKTWRWFGPGDPISLREITQTGATGIVTALHQIPVGELWTEEEILKRRDTIRAEGLTWSVAESIPVHESIKIRSGPYRRHIEKFAGSLRALGASGIDTVCYNFMPVLDWSRTDLAARFRDGTTTTRFDAEIFAAFDISILKRASAEMDYPEEIVRAARQWYGNAGREMKETLTATVLLGFPGSNEAYTLEGLRSALEPYREIGAAALLENLSAFLREVVPVAQEAGVRLAIHPDDPPWPLLGLPRVVSTRADLSRIMEAAEAAENGITLCTGSLGARQENNLVAMAEEFAPRINFVHLRNVHIESPGHFIEEDHIEGDVDMYGVIRAILLEQKRRLTAGRRDRRMPMRPDHGQMMLPDEMLAEMRSKKPYPGYSLWGRMRGMAELRGLERGVERSLDFN